LSRHGADPRGAVGEIDETADAAIPTEEEAFFREIARADTKAPVVEPDLAGTRLGHFRLRSELGRGGMGVVYGAEDLTLRREVALKVLPASVLSDPERRRRLLREARAASVAIHPNIAAVYEVGEADGHVYIAMERVEGRTLRALLEGGRLPVTEALRIGREIARGLARAHLAGVVHRDIKPENVMIGEDGQVKILDFGLAKRAPRDDADPARAPTASDLETAEGRILGTPSYMSPEQARGERVGARSDVFSLGVVLYEMASGVRPFSGSTPMRVLIAIDRDEPAPASTHAPEVPRVVDRILARCLEKLPEARYGDCLALAADLDAASAAIADRRRAWRPPSGLVLAAALGLLLSAAAAAQHLRSGRPDAPDVAPTLPVRAEAPPPSATPALSSTGATEVPAPSVSATGLLASASPPAAKPVPSARRPPVRSSARPSRIDPLADQK
jgi:eukaryotic-like serine/threonine-protein kinase